MDSGASCVAWSSGSATCWLCNLGQVTHLQASLRFLICGMGIIIHLPCRVAVRIEVNVYMYVCTYVCVYTRVHICINVCM